MYSYNTDADGYASFVQGLYAVASHNYSAAFGFGTTSGEQNQFAVAKLLADESITTKYMYITSDDREYDHHSDTAMNDDDEIETSSGDEQEAAALPGSADGSTRRLRNSESAETAAAHAHAARVLARVQPRVRRDAAALGRSETGGDERLVLLTMDRDADADADAASSSRAPPRAGYARSLHGGARTFAFEPDTFSSAAGSASAEDVPACTARLTFDHDAVSLDGDSSGIETVVTRGDWVKLMLEGGSSGAFALVDASSSSSPGARRTEAEHGAAYIHAIVEDVSAVDGGTRVEVRATLTRRCPAAATAERVTYVGATGPWREDLERVDAGAVVAALVAQSNVADGRIAALESAVSKARARRSGGASAVVAAATLASSGGATSGADSTMVFGVPAVLALSLAFAALGFVAGGARERRIRRHYVAVPNHSLI